ncbi:MAG: hypothetical protein FWB74_03475, partial [Defluviitaleaceae bacterium]|nr:hypothetical protein [Defluviitaleaceae bacterium]
MPRRAKNSKKANSKFYSKSIAISLVISVLLLLGISFFNDIVSGEIFWDEVQILTYEDFLPIALEDDFTTVNVLGIGDVLFDILADYDREVGATIDIDPHTLHIPNLEDLRNPATLQNAMYIVNNLTLFVPEMFDVDAF